MPAPAHWLGDFTFLDVANNVWYATNTNNQLAMAGPMLCNATLNFQGGQWQLLIGNTAGGLIWSGVTPMQSSPVGVYTRTNGLDVGPATITIIGSSTPRVSITPPASCFGT